jgi:hypothetical protein
MHTTTIPNTVNFLMKYSTQFSIGIIPHGTPQINYGINEDTINSGLELSVPMALNFNLDLEPQSHTVFIDFDNKPDSDPDMAVEIEYVEFEGMRLDRFRWSSRYRPRYPGHWNTNALPEFYESSTYMGWNGRWELYFETPIFTWIHRLENLGWIYD